MSTIHSKTLAVILGVCLGVAVGEVSPFATEVAVFAFGLGVVQMTLYVLQKRSATEGRASFASLGTMLVCVGLVIGIVRVQFVEEKSNFVCEKSCTFDAVISSSPEQKDTYQLFTVRLLSSGETTREIQLRTPLYPTYTIGETVRITGVVAVPKIFMPHEGGLKSFDYASYLSTRNIGSEMFFPRIEIIRDDVYTLTERLGRLKESLIKRINQYVRAPESSLASGMLFGDTSLSKELTQTFRTAGLSHIVVLSGFNIAIVISCILLVFTFLPLVVRIMFASTAVVLFVMMVGEEASIIRATLMAFVTLLATLLGRQYVAKQALIISLLLIIMYEPYALLHDVSLHLSFLATAGIVYLGEVFEGMFQTISMKSFRELLVTTLSAYISTLPYSMYTFGSVSVYALVANVIALPLVPLAMMLSFSVVVLSYISQTLAFAIGFVDTIVITFILHVAETLEKLPVSSFAFMISFLEMCALYIALYFVVLFVLRTKYLISKGASSERTNETKSTYENGILTDVIRY